MDKKSLCENCGTEFPFRPGKRFCSYKCQDYNYKNIHRAEHRASSREYLARNREKRREYEKRAAAARKVKALYESESCLVCGSDTSLQLHHIIPVAHHGPNSLSNLMILCASCHQRWELMLSPYVVEFLSERTAILRNPA